MIKEEAVIFRLYRYLILTIPPDNPSSVFTCQSNSYCEENEQQFPTALNFTFFQKMYTASSDQKSHYRS